MTSTIDMTTDEYRISCIADNDLQHLVQVALPRQIAYEQSAVTRLFSNRREPRRGPESGRDSCRVHVRMLRSRIATWHQLRKECERRGVWVDYDQALIAATYVTLHVDGTYSLTIRNKKRCQRCSLRQCLTFARAAFGPLCTILCWNEAKCEFDSELRTDPNY